MPIWYIARDQNLGFLVVVVMKKAEEEQDDNVYDEVHCNDRAEFRHLIALKPEKISSPIQIIKNKFYSFNECCSYLC